MKKTLTLALVIALMLMPMNVHAYYGLPSNHARDTTYIGYDGQYIDLYLFDYSDINKGYDCSVRIVFVRPQSGRYYDITGYGSKYSYGIHLYDVHLTEYIWMGSVEATQQQNSVANVYDLEQDGSYFEILYDDRGETGYDPNSAFLIEHTGGSEEVWAQFNELY